MKKNNVDLVKTLNEVFDAWTTGMLTPELSELLEKWRDEEHSKWVRDHAKTRYVPDEMTRVYTVEITETCKRGEAPGSIELTQSEAKTLCKTLEKVLETNLEADDVKVTSFQQFVTKGHEVRIR